MSNREAVLYVVATPIGNLGDISRRALEVLGTCDTVVAEDTRHTRRLLAHFGIRARLLSLHEHNENQRVDAIAERVCAGEQVSLVSDAGTPLISDPGFRLVRELRRRGVAVRAIPGPCSIVAALSVAGLPTDRFVYEGFLPSKPAARRRHLADLGNETRTLVFLESSHRIREAIAALVEAFGGAREAVVARELTKAFETVRLDRLDRLERWVDEDADQRRGEFVLLVAGAEARDARPDPTGGDEQVLRVLLEELPLRQAAKLASRLTGVARNTLYRRGLELDRESDNDVLSRRR